MKISVIIPVVGNARRLNLETCIYFLRQQKNADLEIIIVEQVGCLLKDQNMGGPFYENLKGIDKYIKIRATRHNLFNQPWMSNVGAQEATGDKFLFYDLDLVTESNYIKAVADFNEPYFIAWNRVLHLTPEVSNAIIKRKVLIPDPQCQVIEPRWTHHCGYSVCIERKFFFETLGCYTENMLGWGGNDNEISARARYAMGKEIVPLPKPIFHLFHPRGYAKSNPGNRNLVFATRMFPGEVSRRLKATKLGNKDNPVIVPMKDLIDEMLTRRAK